MYKVELPKFEGPLHLLLQLIEEDNLDITEIALAQVTEQYLEYLKTIEETHPEELADFLVVASQLLLLKSRVLVPFTLQDEEEPTDDLAGRLRMYKEFVVLSEGIEQRLKLSNFIYFCEKIHFQTERVFVAPSGVNASKLHDVFFHVLQRLKPVWELPEHTLEKTVSLAEKVRQLREVLNQKINVDFSELLKLARNRTEVVVSFMALLELIKSHDVRVAQNNVFADIEIRKIT